MVVKVSGRAQERRVLHSLLAIFPAVSFVAAVGVVWARELRNLLDPMVSEDLKGYPWFFRSQAEALIAGRFWVPDDSLGDECYVVDGRCFGYYGLTPSILRLPMLAITSGDLSPLMSGLGYLLNVAAALAILGQVWMKAHQLGLLREGWQGWSLYATLCLLLGPGSITILVTYPDVGNEAILWGSGFILAQLAFVFLWITTHRSLALLGMVLAGLLAALSRPPMLVSAAAISLVVLLIAFRDDRPRSSRVMALLGIFLPVTGALGIFYLKFQELLPDMRRNVFISTSPYWDGILAANGGKFTSWQFVPTNVWNFLRPDAVSYQFSYPRGAFFTPIEYVWPLSDGMMHADPSASITNLVPTALFLVALLLLGILFVADPTLKRWLQGIGTLCIASGLGLLVTWGHVAMTNRNLIDAWPALTLGSVGGGIVVLYMLRRYRRSGLVLLFMTMLLTFVGTGTTLVVMR